MTTPQIVPMWRNRPPDSHHWKDEQPPNWQLEIKSAHLFPSGRAALTLVPSTCSCAPSVLVRAVLMKRSRLTGMARFPGWADHRAGADVASPAR